MDSGNLPNSTNEKEIISIYTTPDHIQSCKEPSTIRLKQELSKSSKSKVLNTSNTYKYKKLKNIISTNNSSLEKAEEKV